MASKEIPLEKNSSGGHWSMGLAGAWKTVANLTAVGLISLLFYQLVINLVEQVKEERTVFREELKNMRDENTREWQAIRDSERAMIELSKIIREDHSHLQKLAVQLESNQKAIAELSQLISINQKHAVEMGRQMEVFLRERSLHKQDKKQ